MKMRQFSIAALTMLIAFGVTNCKKEEQEPQKNIVKLGAQDNETQKGFFSVSEKTTHTLQEAYENQDKVDIFCFYYVEEDYTNETALAGPDSKVKGVFSEIDAAEPNPLDPREWELQRGTRFHMVEDLTKEEYDALTNGDQLIEDTYSEDDGRRVVSLLEVDDIVAFKTEDGTFGLLIVTEVIPGNDGVIEFEYKTR
ncbi:MAG: hypothetical protein ACLFNU_08545 [Bacteroidales bacterium]